MKEITKEDIELLQRIRTYLPNNGGAMVVNAIYISPAQQLRNSADRIENQERDERLFNELISRLSN